MGRRPALDGLRGVAVVLVVADHTHYLDEPAGGIGVVLFFVLSGFLITRMIVEAREAGTWSLRAFVANRFVRLVPALVVMVVVVSAVLLHRGYPMARLEPRAVPALTYVQNMEPYRHFAVFGHTWSLGVEEQFYLVWPLVLPWVLGRARTTIVATTATAIGLSCVAMIVLERDWLPMHAYALLAGCLLGLVGPLPWRWWMFPIGALGVAAAVEAAPHLPRIYVYGPMVATPAAVLLVMAATGGSRVLELPPLRFLGRVSYALYLWHVPMLRLSGTIYQRSAALPTIGWALVVATASTFLLEEPLRRGWRRRTAARPPRLVMKHRVPS